MRGETWVPVVGFEREYEVSDMGRVRSVDRYVRNGETSTRLRKGRVLRHGLSGSGYPQVNLSSGGKNKVLMIHRLVMAAFVGGCQKGVEVCHHDGQKTNNFLKNLRYDTKKSNAADRYKHGTHHCGEKSPNAKLTNESVSVIRKSLLTYGKLAAMFGVSEAAVGMAKRGVTWRNCA